MGVGKRGVRKWRNRMRKGETGNPRLAEAMQGIQRITTDYPRNRVEVVRVMPSGRVVDRQVFTRTGYAAWKREQGMKPW